MRATRVWTSHLLPYLCGKLKYLRWYINRSNCGVQTSSVPFEAPSRSAKTVGCLWQED